MTSGGGVRPYYEDEWATVYHGDCRDVLPTLESVDSVITDPPYGLATGYGRTALGLRHIEGDEDTALLQWVFGAGAAVLKDEGWVCVFTGYSGVGDAQNAAVAAGLDVKSVVVWDKGLPSLGEGIRNQYEMCVLARKGTPEETWVGGNVWTVRRPTARPDHPHQKPHRLMSAFVDRYSPLGGTVLDPFMGSGSTLVAARQAGRRAIGIEVEERYCELAAARLAQGALDFGAATNATPGGRAMTTFTPAVAVGSSPTPEPRLRDGLAHSATAAPGVTPGGGGAVQGSRPVVSPSGSTSAAAHQRGLR